MEQCFINVEDIEVHIELPILSGDHLTRSQKTTVISGKGIVLEPIRLKEKKSRRVSMRSECRKGTHCIFN
jgi:hypothetical protein